MSDHHWYGTTAFDWVCADTKEAVIKRLARMSGAKTIQLNVKRNGGLFAQVCRVELPQAAHYSINEYLPHRITKEDGVHEQRKGEVVPLTEVQSIRITTASGKYIEVKR